MARLLLALLFALGCRSKVPELPDAAPTAVVPAAQADSRAALQLGVHSERAGTRERLRLEAGGGLAILELGSPQKPVGEPSFGGFGDCTLSAPSAEEGARFVATVAKWLGVDDVVPATRQPLQPVPCSFALLGPGRDGAGRSWVAYKLFLEGAEIFLRLSPDHSLAELLEKDSDYRPDLVAFLARALRDGPPLRAELSKQPVLSGLRPVQGIGAYSGWGQYAGAVAWIGQELVSTHESEQRTRILRWARLDGAPSELATVDAVVYRLQLDPSSKRIALEAVFPRRKGWISGDDPLGLLMLEVATGKVTTLRKIDERGVPLNSCWSPDGKAIAVAVPWPEAGRHESQMTAVYDVASGKAIAESKLNVHPIRWNGDGLLLGDGFAPAEGTVRFLWSPGHGTPTSVQMASPTWRNGAHSLRVNGKALEIDGARRFEPTEESERRAVAALREAAPRWLGEHLVSLGKVVLDVRSMALHPLSGSEADRLVGVDPTGRIALVHDREHPMRWVRVAH